MMNEKERKVAALMALSLNFGKEFPKELFPIWMMGLKPYSAEEVERAVFLVIQDYQYKTIPPFAELKKYLPNRSPVLPDPEKEKAVKAEAEWQYIMNSVGPFGRYNEPPMHPTTAYVIRGMGGWWAVCDWLESELHWRKEEFLKTWCQTDGLDIAMLEGGARAIEQGQAQIALGNDDDRTLKRITRSVVRRLEA